MSSILRLKSGQSPRTRVTISKKETGEVLFQDSNIIVQQGIYAYLLGLTQAYTTSPLTTLQLGLGGTADPQGLIPLVPARTQTQLNSYLTSLPLLVSAPTLSSTEVTFLATLPTGSANGSLISEAGMFTTSGVMQNYITFPGITKISEFSLNISWSVSV